MNIKEAKEQVRYTVQSYLTKNQFGKYSIPVMRQRPLFLVGPPGIGKTEIMEQVASEMNIALVSYSMTHHTRQSALGLPFIVDKEYGDKEYRTTEYTMSEIISSVYDVIEETGREEGILFLDEINCISETLAPSMLQFLQNKTFGKHRVPDGWVIITAGNPLEYNDSARDFDLATRDRLKELKIEPDFKSWHEYAENAGIHGSILAYLEVHPDDFYSIRTVMEGKEFMTARGWVDMSEMIDLYEQNGLPVDINLVSQYVKDQRIARDYTAFYDIFFRYKEEYHIRDILKGEPVPEALEKAHQAKFDERLAVVQQIGDSLKTEFRDLYEEGRALAMLMNMIREHKNGLAGSEEDALEEIRSMKRQEEERVTKAEEAKALSMTMARISLRLCTLLDEMEEQIRRRRDTDLTMEQIILRELDRLRRDHRNNAETAGVRLHNAFVFIGEAYYGDKEMLIFMTNITQNRYIADHIMTYGSDDYYAHSQRLQLEEREQALVSKIEALGV